MNELNNQKLIIELSELKDITGLNELSKKLYQELNELKDLDVKTIRICENIILVAKDLISIHDALIYIYREI